MTDNSTAYYLIYKYNKMTYGKALEAINEGELLQRKVWDGKGMFIFQRPSDNIPVAIVLKVKSLPTAVKDYFKNKDGLKTIHFNSYLCMKLPNDDIKNGWVPSETDIISDDWVILSS